MSSTGGSWRSTSSTALGHSSGSVAQQRELVGVLVEQGEAVAEQVDGGLEAGGEHEPDGGLELGVGEPAVVVAGGDELAEQVVAGVAADGLDVVGEPAPRTPRSADSIARKLRQRRPRSRLGAAAVPNRSTRPRSSGGTPRISAITVTGSRLQ